MASSPRVPCVQETARQERYENLTNVTGTPITVVDTVCGGQAPPAPTPPGGTDGDIGAVAIQGTENCSVGFSGRYYLVPEPGAADATYVWSVDTGANVTAPNTGESAEVNFTAAGTTVITCVITSATATDSPVTVTKEVTIS